jgi:hypothetical protein
MEPVAAACTPLRAFGSFNSLHIAGNRSPVFSGVGLTTVTDIQKRSFPLSRLKARHAILSGEPHDVSIEVLLDPFLWVGVAENSIFREGELIDTKLRLDGIDLPSVHLADLIGQKISFPLNPDEAAIDGSIYLGSAHHPIDVTSIAFIRSRDDKTTVLIQGTYIFEHEGLDDFKNTSFTIGVCVSSCAI